MSAPNLVKLKRASILGRFGQHLASSCLKGILLLTLMAWCLSLGVSLLVPATPRWELVSLGPVALIAGQLVMLASLRHPKLGALEIDLTKVDPETDLTRGSWTALGADLPPTPEELLAAWQEKMWASASS